MAPEPSTCSPNGIYAEKKFINPTSSLSSHHLLCAVRPSTSALAQQLHQKKFASAVKTNYLGTKKKKSTKKLPAELMPTFYRKCLPLCHLTVALSIRRRQIWDCYVINRWSQHVIY
jgi:hypothetical protein